MARYLIFLYDMTGGPVMLIPHIQTIDTMTIRSFAHYIHMESSVCTGRDRSTGPVHYATNMIYRGKKRGVRVRPSAKALGLWSRTVESADFGMSCGVYHAV